MIGTIRSHWQYMWADVWQPLADDPDAPPDMFMRLYRRVVDFLAQEPDPPTIEQIINEPGSANEAFRQIQGSHFRSESAITSFLEDAYTAIDDFGIPLFAESYTRILREFIERYNLRYRIVTPFHLSLELPGIFAGLYADLSQINCRDEHLAALMGDFEKSFDTYARSRSNHDLAYCISRATNYAEGIAATTLDTRGGTLGRLCDQISCWPHAAVKDALKDLYRFSSDYPGIRHAGNPANKLRDLDVKDAMLISVLMITFSGYLTNGVDVQAILGAG